MKKRSPFDRLNAAQKEKVLELCENLPFEEVVQALALPVHMGGFELRTSYSSVRRFYVKHHPDLRDYDTVGRHAEALQIAYEKSAGAVGTAIIALMEAKIYDCLKSGASVTHVDKDLRVLSTVQRTQLALAKWRLAHPEAANAKAAEFDRSCAEEDRALQALAETPATIPFQPESAPKTENAANTESEPEPIGASPASIQTPLPADPSADQLLAPSPSSLPPLDKPVDPLAPTHSGIEPSAPAFSDQPPRPEPRPVATAASEVSLADTPDPSALPAAAAPDSPARPELSAQNTPKNPVKPHYPHNPEPSFPATSPPADDSGRTSPPRRKARGL